MKNPRKPSIVKAAESILKKNRQWTGKYKMYIPGLTPITPEELHRVAYEAERWGVEFIDRIYSRRRTSFGFYEITLIMKKEPKRPVEAKK